MKKFFILFALFSLCIVGIQNLSFADSPRKILIEEATNTGCGPCAVQNPSFKRFVMNNFSDVIPLVYHAWWPSGSDPMYLENTAMNTARIQYYGIQNIGVPNVRVNGKIAPKTGNWYDGAAGDTVAIKNEVDKYRGTSSPITLTVAENRSGSQSTVQVTISTTQSLVGKKLRVAVVEYQIVYPNPPGSNGEKEFFWVARNMLPDANGTTLDLQAGSNRTYTFNYSIKSNWNSQQIYIIAFIQDDQTKEVLQAAQNLKVAKVNVQASDNPFLKIPRKGQVEYTFNVTNPSNELLRVNVALNSETSYVPSGWSATLNTTQLILQPNQTQQVKVTLKSGNKAEFSVIGIDFKPNVQYPFEVTTGYFYALTEDTKYAFYVLANSPSPYFAYQGILNQPKYANDAALLPFALDILNNYPAVNFDLAMFGFSFALRGVLGGYFVESSPLFATLNSMISAGKSILLTSEVDLAFSQGTQGSATARDFYANKLFINKAQEPVLRVTTNSQGQITAINPYPANGFSGDPIGNGISLTMNQYNQSSHPYFIVFTDIIGITNQNKTKPIIYYDNNQSAIGGVRVENGDSRIVYLTSGFEAIADPTRRNGFAGKIFDWLLSRPSVKLGPQITLSQTAIDFEEVIVGTTASKTFDIRNSGDEDLIITELRVDRDFDPEEVFNIKNPPSLPLTIKPNQSYTVEVTFSPKDESVSYTSTIIIKSNAKNAPDELVTLDGIGVAGNVPLITASKSEINFGTVQLQNTKISDVDIKNSGLADLTITNLTIANNPGVFSVMNPAQLPLTIGPGETFTVSIIFAPTEARDYSAFLRISSNANNEPTLNIPLYGTGEIAGFVAETQFSNGIRVRISPIPIENEFNLIFEANESTSNFTAKLELYDLRGTLMLTFNSLNLKQGTTQEKFFVELPSGHYNLRIQIGDETQFIPVVIVK